ncbi:MAG: D-aminoacylase [Chloroflexota bacterium]|nr:D-aminoacylase [Chloroflexota bacterium]
MNFDLVITDGTVIDGTGRPRFRADLGIRDGRIAAMTTSEHLTGGQTLDATGLVVAPGFIDVHSHSDWILPLPDHDQILAPLLLQGITTLVTGNCGFSLAPITEDSIPLVDGFSEEMRERASSYRWRSMAEFLDTLEGDRLMFNAAFLVGHGTLRYAVLGGRADGPAPPTPEEMDLLCHLTRQALREGAFGLSAGLAYTPGVFARNEELLPLLRVVAEEGGIFTVHGRAYTWVSPFYKPMIVGTSHNVRSTRELLALARQAGVRLQLSHLIFVGRRTWRTYRTVLRDVEQAAASGLDVAFDAFPYTVGNSTINVVFPDWFLDGFAEKINDPRILQRLKREINLLRWTLGLDYRDIVLLWGCAPELAELEGLDFAAIARRLGKPEFEAYLHVARVSAGKARVLLGTYSGDGEREKPLRAVLAHPLCAFMTDTLLTQRGQHNPASFGTFPRVLGRYSRDLGLFPLEEAVRRMTSFPAERIGLADVGRIAEGGWADLVLFDPAAVADNTTPDRPDVPPTGIRAVLISGQVIARDGQIVSRERRGRVLRR